MMPPRMVEPFGSSWRKVARAKKHIEDLNREIQAFKEAAPCAVVTECGPHIQDEQFNQIKFIKTLPASLAEIVSDVADNLRAALDQAGYAVALISGKHAPKYSAFPFAGSADQFEDALNGRSKDIPQEIRALFRTFKPYRGGNDLLWALNEICVGNKHKMLVPIGTALTVYSLTATIPAKSAVEIPIIRPTWNAASNQIVVAVERATAKYQYNFDFYISVASDEIEVVRGKPAVSVLNALAGEVEIILFAIEAEARRLGFVK